MAGISRAAIKEPGSLAGKRVGLVGLGQENEYLIPYLASERAEIEVLDQLPLTELSAKKRRLLERFSLRYQGGPGYLVSLSDFDVIFRIPGLSPRHPALKQARNHGVLVMPSIELFMLRTEARIIGVTGTKGKGTTSSLIAHLLERSGFRTHVAGNIGVAAFSLLPTVTKEDIVVLELSSFQLEDMQTSPNIAVVLPVTVDHLAPLSPSNPNYHQNMVAYRQAKEPIVCYQEKRDIAVISTDGPSWHRYARRSQGKVLLASGLHKLEEGGVYFSYGQLLLKRPDRRVHLAEAGDSPLFGRHNWTNVTAAVAAALAAGMPARQVKSALRSYKPLPHRLEMVAEKNGILYVNDSYSTNPQTAAAALRAFSRPIFLIAGGTSKGADFAPLAEAVREMQVKNVCTIGQEAERIRRALEAEGLGDLVLPSDTLNNAYAEISRRAETGDAVLLSPACASFDQFQSAADRGEQFRRLVLDGGHV